MCLLVLRQVWPAKAPMSASGVRSRSLDYQRRVILDRTQTIEESIVDVGVTLLLALEIAKVSVPTDLPNI